MNFTDCCRTGNLRELLQSLENRDFLNINEKICMVALYCMMLHIMIE